MPSTKHGRVGRRASSKYGHGEDVRSWRAGLLPPSSAGLARTLQWWNCGHPSADRVSCAQLSRIQPTSLSVPLSIIARSCANLQPRLCAHPRPRDRMYTTVVKTEFCKSKGRYGPECALAVVSQHMLFCRMHGENEEEAGFRNMKDGSRQVKKGHEIIEFWGEQAALHGLQIE